MTPISIGETLSGTWDKETPSTYKEESYAKYFTFSLAETTKVKIFLKADVDTSLFLLRGLVTDDDMIALGDAEIVETIPPGNYSIEAALYDPRWMASFEISLSSEDAPITPATNISTEAAIPATINVTISKLVNKGEVKRTQADEYVEISNSGNSPANISGWKITSVGTAKQLFTFPQGTILEAGKSFRVYTNQVHPETGGFSFGSKTAIWNDAGDEAKLFDGAGKNVSSLAYGK